MRGGRLEMRKRVADADAGDVRERAGEKYLITVCSHVGGIGNGRLTVEERVTVSLSVSVALSVSLSTLLSTAFPRIPCPSPRPLST